MHHPNPAPNNPAPGHLLLRNTVAIGVLAALFAGGLLLLYGLMRSGDEIPLAQQRASGDEPQAQTDPGSAVQSQATANAAPRSPRPAPEPMPQGARESTAGAAARAPRAEPASATEVDALRDRVSSLAAALADTRARIDSLSERTASFADAHARIEALDERVTAARQAADAAARAAEVAQRFGSLPTDDVRLGARFTPEGVLIRLDEAALAFAPGSAALPAGAGAALADIAAFLQRHPDQQALLRGHTDATGAPAANLELSEARAAAVRDALIALGVRAGRLRIEGAGAAEPIADNASAEGRRRNRRVDILFLEPG